MINRFSTIALAGALTALSCSKDNNDGKLPGPGNTTPAEVAAETHMETVIDPGTQYNCRE